MSTTQTHPSGMVTLSELEVGQVVVEVQTGARHTVIKARTSNGVCVVTLAKLCRNGREDRRVNRFIRFGLLASEWFVEELAR